MASAPWAFTDQPEHKEITFAKGLRNAKVTGIAINCEHESMVIEPKISSVPNDCWGLLQMNVYLSDSKIPLLPSQEKAPFVRALGFPELSVATEFSNMVEAAFFFLRNELPRRIKLSIVQVQIIEDRRQNYGRQLSATSSTSGKSGLARIQTTNLQRKDLNEPDLDLSGRSKKPVNSPGRFPTAIGAPVSFPRRGRTNSVAPAKLKRSSKSEPSAH